MLDRNELGKFRNITTATTTVAKTGPGGLLSITVNDAAAASLTGAITIYDNTSATGTLVATATAIPVGTTLFYGVQFTTGLTIVTASADNLTVSYA